MGSAINQAMACYNYRHQGANFHKYDNLCFNMKYNSSVTFSPAVIPKEVITSVGRIGRSVCEGPTCLASSNGAQKIGGVHDNRLETFKWAKEGRETI